MGDSAARGLSLNVKAGQLSTTNSPNSGNVLSYSNGLLQWIESKVIWTGTQTQYDAIVTKDNNTLYFITL